MSDWDLKWEQVKEFYESNYDVVFTYRLPNAKVDFLYEQMMILASSLDRHERVARQFLTRIGATRRSTSKQE